MTIMLNYGKKGMNVCDWQLFHIVNKLKQRFFHESLTPVTVGLFIAG
jgi:hypothetical protein